MPSGFNYRVQHHSNQRLAHGMMMMMQLCHFHGTNVALKNKFAIAKSVYFN